VRIPCDLSGLFIFCQSSSAAQTDPCRISPVHHTDTAKRVPATGNRDPTSTRSCAAGPAPELAAAELNDRTSGSCRVIASLETPRPIQATAVAARRKQHCLAPSRAVPSSSHHCFPASLRRLLQRCPPRSSPPPPAGFTSARPRLGRGGADAATSRLPRSRRRRTASAAAPSPWPASPPGSPLLSGVSTISISCVPFGRRPGSASACARDAWLILACPNCRLFQGRTRPVHWTSTSRGIQPWPALTCFGLLRTVTLVLQNTLRPLAVLELLLSGRSWSLWRPTFRLCC
jgi:hypothetical protein